MAVVPVLDVAGFATLFEQIEVEIGNGYPFFIQIRFRQDAFGRKHLVGRAENRARAVRTRNRLPAQIAH